jgi:phosphoglycolate phosphatase
MMTNDNSNSNGSSPTGRRLVLFDIDGTILRGGGAGRRAMEGALEAYFGTKGEEGFHYDGKTDKQIVRELMRAEGYDDEHIDSHLGQVLSQYLRRLEVEFVSPKAQHKPSIFPGVLELLDRLEKLEHVVLGLLTGNIEEGARLKLRAVGIDPSRFRVNAFGSDHEHRPELPAIAQRRANESLGHEIAGERIVVIGDTPADIQCGRSIGARSIGVATGRFSVAELEEHGPWAVFKDLSETDRVLQSILHA